MKKLLLMMLLMTVWCGLSVAEPVTQQQALQKAQQFRKGKVFNSPKKMARIGRKGVAASSAPAYYIFNAADNGGFVIVSGDDRTEPILGYADSGEIDPANMPDNLRAWLDGYAEQIGALDQTADARRALLTPRAAIAPMVTTQWDQSSPYNLQCPEHDGKLCVTGCVATAMAQVMYYHHWPETATPAIPAYDTDELGLHLDKLPTTTFKWTTMKTTYTADETGDAADAVAELMRYCGQSAKMSYTPSGSGASVSDMLTALTSYFGYSKAATIVTRANYTTAEWEDIIYKEISERRPVLYTGDNLTGGHEFVCDGSDADGLFHINWGWGGRSDGYFVLSLLNPYDKGIGGGTSRDGYTVRQAAVIGLEPDKGQAKPKVAKAMEIYVEPGEYPSFGEFYLWGSASSPSDSELEVGWGLFDANGNFVKQIGESRSMEFDTNSTQGFGQYIYVSNYFNQVQDGDYLIYMVYRDEENNIVKCINAVDYPIVATVSSGSVTLTNSIRQNIQVNSVTLDSGNDNVACKPQTVTVNLTNQGYTHEHTFYVWLNGLLVGQKSAYVDHGQTDDVAIIFTPMDGMTSATLKVTTDSRGENAVHTENLTITPAATLADGDFFVCKTVEGVEMTFKVISAVDKTCQLGDGSHAAIDKTATGTVTVPVAPNGYKIMKIASRAFLKCSVSKIVFKESIADARSTTASYWFYGCSNLTAIEGLEYVNTSEVLTMQCMFYSCSSLTSLDLSNFDTSKVSDMRWMFWGCSGLESLNVSSFNTSKITSMYSMFCDCSSLTSLDVSSFDTSNVTEMLFAFYNCSKLTSLNLSNFNTSKITTMYAMFYNCRSLTSLNLSNFDTSNVTDMGDMFSGCSSLTSLNLSNFDTSNVEYMSDMFSGCSSLTSLDLSHFDTSNVEYMSDMFSGCSSLTSLDLSHFDTSNVEYMSNMFSGCSSLTSLDLSNFDMRNVYYANMINGCSSLTKLTLPALVDEFDSETFTGCTTLTTITSLIQDPTRVGLADDAFDADVYTTATLIVPAGTVELYKAADGWKLFENIVSGETVSATIAASGFGTFSSDYAVNFDATDITPYYASAAANGTITMTRLTGDIAAGTGLYLKHDTGKAGVYSIPVASNAGTSPVGNLLKATTGSDIYNGTKHQYVYASQSSVFNFYKVGSSLTVAKGKAYLETDAAAGINAGARMAIVFGDENDATSISFTSKDIAPEDRAVYNLQGQRVSQPAKGLYLVNGKKVIIK